MNKKTMGILLSVSMTMAILAGCGQKQDIGEAYERAGELSATISESVPEIIDNQTTKESTSGKEEQTTAESTSKKEENQTTTESSSKKETEQTYESGGMPPRVLYVDAEVLSEGSEIEYSGMKMKIEKAFITDSMDTLKNAMDANDAETFAQQINKRGVQYDSSYEKILIIKGTIQNNTGKERLMDMGFPVYWFANQLDTGTLSGSIKMSDFMAEGTMVDFWGEHTTNVSPNVGVQTSGSTQYHTFATGEVLDTVMVFYILNEHIESGKLYMGSNVMAEKLYIGDLPKGTQLVPINYGE